MQTLLIVANFEGLQAVRHRLNSAGSSREIAVFFMVGLAIAAFWAGLYFWDRRRQLAPVAVHSIGLFSDLCLTHGLSKEERMLLQRVAAEMPHPAFAFVEPNYLLRFGQTHPADALPCAQLRERLFGL